MIKKILIFTSFIIIAVFVSYIQATPMVIDTDSGYDDILALIYLIKNPNIKIKAISITNGVTLVDEGYVIVSKLLTIAKKINTPIIKGNRLIPEPDNYKLYRFDNPKKVSDSILNINEFRAIPAEENNQAYSLPTIFENLLKNDKKIILVALGPLTNIAELISKKPYIKEKIKEIWIMGGAFNTKGNMECFREGVRSTTAELNFFLDPKSADKVISSGIPIFLVTLDATKKIPLSKEKIEILTIDTKKNSSPLNVINNKILKLMGSGEGKYLWDVITVVLATNPRLATYRAISAGFSDDLNNCGVIKIQKQMKGSVLKTVEKINADSIYKTYFNKINR